MTDHQYDGTKNVTGTAHILDTAIADPREHQVVDYERQGHAAFAEHGLLETALGERPAKLTTIIDHPPELGDHVSGGKWPRSCSTKKFAPACGA